MELNTNDQSVADLLVKLREKALGQAHISTPFDGDDISIQAAAAKAEEATEIARINTIPGSNARMKTFTFDVQFLNTLGETVKARVVESSVLKAMHAAADAIGNNVLKNFNKGVQAVVVDIDAEARIRYENEHLFAQYSEAKAIFIAAEFYESTTGWFYRKDLGLAGFVDEPMSTGGLRTAGLYNHKLDENMRDIMSPIGQIPWYGDGADASVAIAMLRGMVQGATSR